MTRWAKVVALGIGVWAAQVSVAAAQTVVKVLLWDKGEASMEMDAGMAPMGMAMPGADMAMATMGITPDVTTVPAGPVTFQVTNDSQSFYHSVDIVAVADTTTALPYLDEARMVDLAAAGSVAQVKEMRSHASGSVTVDLAPGTYVLLCNIAGHYEMGMWTVITVTG